MSIDTKQYVLADAGTGDLLSDATRVAPEILGAAIYDMAGDIEAVADYADEYGTELYAPGDANVGEGVDLETLQGFVAIDQDSGRVVPCSSLRLIDVAELDAVDVEDAVAMVPLARAGIVPVVSDEVYDLPKPPFEDVNE